MPEPHETFAAQLILKRADGGSILDAEGPITAETLARFRVPDDRIAFVRAELERMGFDVPQGDATSLSVTGPRELFATVFGLEAAAASSNVAAHATRIPDELSGHVADVVITPRPELFP